MGSEAEIESAPPHEPWPEQPFGQYAEEVATKAAKAKRMARVCILSCEELLSARVVHGTGDRADALDTSFALNG